MNKNICEFNLGNARYDWISLICPTHKKKIVFIMLSYMPYFPIYGILLTWFRFSIWNLNFNQFFSKESLSGYTI